ncbi:MAG TPA: non-ribosomal peptide synthetase, partial [Pseudonocardiaceae bacterium]
RTGDQVLWSADGDLVFLGRDDQQVKIRGHRVELGDIEATANAIPGVAQAVAAARGDGSDRHLLLFLRREPGASVTPALVTERLSAALPGYMVPTRVLLVDTVPTTGNGKVDRAALLGMADRLIAADRDSGPREHIAPKDPLERWLLELWTELLGRDDLSTGRSLLECGAHSLNVLTALGRIETERGVRVPVLDFFRAPTVTALAALVRANTTNGSRS